MISSRILLSSKCITLAFHCHMGLLTFVHGESVGEGMITKLLGNSTERLAFLPGWKLESDQTLKLRSGLEARCQGAKVATVSKTRPPAQNPNFFHLQVPTPTYHHISVTLVDSLDSSVLAAVH